MTPAGQTMVQQPQGTQPHQAKVWRDEFAQFNKPDNSLGQSQQQGHQSWEPTKTNQPKTSKSNNNPINRTHLDIIPMGNIVSVKILACHIALSYSLLFFQIKQSTLNSFPIIHTAEAGQLYNEDSRRSPRLITFHIYHTKAVSFSIPAKHYLKNLMTPPRRWWTSPRHHIFT